VSVIIPCYKHAQYLPRAIESALAQTYPRVEIIVVDDGSPDDTADVALRYADRGVKLVRQSNAGLSAARNAGVRAASAEWLLFLDADDWIDADVVERMAATAQRGCSLVHCSWRRVSAEGTELQRSEARALEGDTTHALLAHNFTPVHSVLVRRDLVELVGGFHEELRAVEDWDLWLRISVRGGPFIPCAGAWVSYVQTADSMSSSGARMALAGLQVLSRARRLHPGCEVCRRVIPEVRWGFRHSLWRELVDGATDIKSPAGRAARAVLRAVRHGQPAVALVPVWHRLRGARL
jgi:glycosyltransferase involved in cell wall biosynthesis